MSINRHIYVYNLLNNKIMFAQISLKIPINILKYSSLKEEAFAVISHRMASFCGVLGIFIYLVIVLSIHIYKERFVFCYFWIWERFCQNWCKPCSEIFVIVFLVDEWASLTWVQGTDPGETTLRGRERPSFILSVGAVVELELQMSM